MLENGYTFNVEVDLDDRFDDFDAFVSKVKAESVARGYFKEDIILDSKRLVSSGEQITKENYERKIRHVGQDYPAGFFRGPILWVGLLDGEEDEIPAAARAVMSG